jgi:MFS family permease
VGIAALLAGTSLYLFSASLPVYLHRTRGYPLDAVGILVGLASVVQLVASLAVGPFLDRRGARIAMRLGAASYVLAAVLFLLGGSLLAVVAARILQGIGIALVLPSVFSIVPAVVARNMQGTALGLVGAINNVALAAAPPLGLFLLARSPQLLFAAAMAAAAVGFGMSWLLRVGLPIKEPGRLLKYRTSWTALYAITFLCVVYWGVVTAFLPVEVPSSQVPNVGWFFTADAVGVMAARIPAGYLADRFGARWLLVIGAVTTASAIGLLTLPASLASLVIAGIATGVSAALMLPPILLELTKRSNDTDRGTAMALYNTSFAAAVGTGSLAGAFLVQGIGFHRTLFLTMVLALAGAPVALAAVRRIENY